MLTLALVLFVAVALGGDFMTIQIVRKRPYPAILPTVHWVVSAAGLAVLATAVATTPVPQSAWIALAIFAAGFVGGWILFRVMFAGQRPPILYVVAHSSLGFAGIVALVIALFG